MRDLLRGPTAVRTTKTNDGVASVKMAESTFEPVVVTRTDLGSREMHRGHHIKAVYEEQ